ncbi:COG3650 family protein [Erythrobacter sp. W302b]|uniref:COG3650 family protein n=1 Tax=Erythrobacter sp. W302b TaxID=3389874 RepID=UPI00396B20DD
MLATHSRTALCLLLAAAAACTPAADGIDPQGKTFDAVTPEDAVTLTGTEPFWTLAIAAGEGVWTTPDNQPGTRFAVQRFAGNNGLGFSGELDGKPLTATLTPGACSDGMSDRRFPFVATIALGGETFKGCGYTTRQPFTGEEAP